MSSTPWPRTILQRFGGAASTYDGHARLQRAIAWRLAALCHCQRIPAGLWMDLGAGTGLLADALEAWHPGQIVGRLDGSAAMLDCQASQQPTMLWDLQQGLPAWPAPPRLLASSFCLHWLPDPGQHLEEWFACLPSGSWMAVALPVMGSFPQWHQAAAAAGERCTALPLPNRNELLQRLPASALRHQSLHRFSQQAASVNDLLRPLRRVGAGATPSAPLSVRAWRRLHRHWPAPADGGLRKLTWQIQLLLVER